MNQKDAAKNNQCRKPDHQQLNEHQRTENKSRPINKNSIMIEPDGEVMMIDEQGMKQKTHWMYEPVV